MQDINTTPKEPKTERVRNHRQRFRPFRPQMGKQLSTAVAVKISPESEIRAKILLLHAKSKIRAQKRKNQQSAAIARSGNPLKSRFESEIRAKNICKIRRSVRLFTPLDYE